MNFGVNVLPTTTETYNLGSSTKKWDNVYTETLNGTDVDTLGTVHRYTATVSRKGPWSTDSESGIWWTIVTVTGLLASDTNGKVSVAMPSTYTLPQEKEVYTAFSYILSAKSFDDILQVKFIIKPSVDIPLQIEVIR